jgi:hypothetical protein
MDYTWSRQKTDGVKSLCDEIILSTEELVAASGFGGNGTGIDQAISAAALNHFKNIALASVQLKHLNREVHFALEKKRKQVESEKNVVVSLTIECLL